MVYTHAMVEVRRTDAFAKWFGSLRDKSAQTRIAIRVRRIELGLPGDAKPVGGGDKRSQAADIKAARALSEQL